MKANSVKDCFWMWMGHWPDLRLGYIGRAWRWNDLDLSGGFPIWPVCASPVFHSLHCLLPTVSLVVRSFIMVPMLSFFLRVEKYFLIPLLQITEEKWEDWDDFIISDSLYSLKLTDIVRICVCNHWLPSKLLYGYEITTIRDLMTHLNWY